LSQGDTLKNSCTSWRNLLTPSGVVPRTDIKNALLQKTCFPTIKAVVNFC